ncbi:MAG TPA: tRNA lysidine(34) synthetase TilS [Thermoanaerobaculia bacterium]|nr:tRNA lysidine(34) synthetase TilS [Thermoanaerobaculia bacterium]
MVAAVSGGADSTALLHALSELRADGFVIECAHVNHHLRGDASDGDEAFVRDLAAQLGVPLHVEDGTLASSESNVEAMARQIRYAKLQAVRARTGAKFIATAHHKNDQAETVLMRVVNGSGLAGLRGIHELRDDGVIRPMLALSREEIEDELRARGIAWRHDSSNDDVRFLRNRIRTLLRELGPAAIDNLATVAAQAAQQWPLVESVIDSAEKVLITADETRFLEWPDDAWLRQALLQRHIRRLDPESRDVSAADLARLANATRRTSVTKSVELLREDDHVVLRHRTTERPPVFESTLTAGTPLVIPEIATTIHIDRFNGTSNGQRFQLPPNAFPTFIIRNRRPGDRFHPLGMPQSKKLKDFLIDRKIAARIRDTLPLLLWNGEIVWVAGVEVSEGFKVTANPRGDQYVVWLEGAGGFERDQTGLQR